MSHRSLNRFAHYFSVQCGCFLPGSSCGQQITMAGSECEQSYLSCKATTLRIDDRWSVTEAELSGHW